MLAWPQPRKEYLYGGAASTPCRFTTVPATETTKMADNSIVSLRTAAGANGANWQMVAKGGAHK